MPAPVTVHFFSVITCTGVQFNPASLLTNNCSVNNSYISHYVLQ